MRFLASLGLGCSGLALVFAAVARGDEPAPPPANYVAPQNMQTSGNPHHHKGLFAWRHCVECQRAWAKKHDGVDIPPRPEPRRCRPWQTRRFIFMNKARPAPPARQARWQPAQ